MPLGPDVGENIKELEAAHPDWPHDRVLAAALSGARRAGGDGNSRSADKSQGGRLTKKGHGIGRVA